MVRPITLQFFSPIVRMDGGMVRRDDVVCNSSSVICSALLRLTIYTDSFVDCVTGRYGRVMSTRLGVKGGEDEGGH